MSANEWGTDAQERNQVEEKIEIAHSMEHSWKSLVVPSSGSCRY